MSKNDMREAILAQFIDPPKINFYAFNKTLPATRKGRTLADFYKEVFQSSKPLYDIKSAQEIELMMMQNRKLIEAKNKRR
jgi:hypothetical protein